MSNYEVFLGLGPRGDFPEGYLRELIDGLVRDRGYHLRYHTKFAFVDCCNDADSKALESLGGFRSGSSVMQARCEDRNNKRGGGMNNNNNNNPQNGGGGMNKPMMMNGGGGGDVQQRGFRPGVNRPPVPGEKRDRDADVSNTTSSFSSSRSSSSDSSCSSMSSHEYRRRRRRRRERKEKKRSHKKDKKSSRSHHRSSHRDENGRSPRSQAQTDPSPQPFVLPVPPPTSYVPQTMESFIEGLYRVMPKPLETVKLTDVLKGLPLREGARDADVPSVELFTALTSEAQMDVIKMHFAHDLSLDYINEKLAKAPEVAASRLLTVFRELLVSTEDDWLGSGAYPPGSLATVPQPVIRKLDETAMMLYSLNTAASSGAASA